jgi:hypothetical protein
VPARDGADPFAELVDGDSIGAAEEAGKALKDAQGGFQQWRDAISAGIAGLRKEPMTPERNALLREYAAVLYRTAQEAKAAAKGDLRWMGRLPQDVVRKQLADAKVREEVADDLFLIRWLLQEQREMMEEAMNTDGWAADFLPAGPLLFWVWGVDEIGLSVMLGLESWRQALGGRPRTRDWLLDRFPAVAADAMRVPGAGRDLFGEGWVKEVMGRPAIRDSLFPPAGWQGRGPGFGPGVLEEVLRDPAGRQVLSSLKWTGAWLRRWQPRVLRELKREGLLGLLGAGDSGAGPEGRPVNLRGGGGGRDITGAMVAARYSAARGWGRVRRTARPRLPAGFSPWLRHGWDSLTRRGPPGMSLTETLRQGQWGPGGKRRKGVGAGGQEAR